MFDVLPALQEVLLPIVKYALISLAILFAFLLVIYLVSIFIHARQNRHITGKTAQWQSLVNSLLRDEKSPNEFNIPRGERKNFRDILIAECVKQDMDGKSRIRDLYKQFLLLAILFGVLLSLFSLLLEEFTMKRYENPKDVAKLFVLAVLENFGYRQLHSWWRLKAFYDLIRKKRAWGEMERKAFVQT